MSWIIQLTYRCKLSQRFYCTLIFMQNFLSKRLIVLMFYGLKRAWTIYAIKSASGSSVVYRSTSNTLYQIQFFVNILGLCNEKLKYSFRFKIGSHYKMYPNESSFCIFLEMFILILQMYHKLFSDHLWSGRICIRKGLRSCFPQECSIITWTWFNFHFSNSISLNSNARELRATWVEYHMYYPHN